MQKQYLICESCGGKMKCDRRATGKAAKVHGSGFEHKVAKQLERATQLKWKKTPASGGMHLAGDVFCLDYKKMPFVIECKNDERITVARVLRDPEFLWTADDGDPLVTPDDKVAIINNAGTLTVIMSMSLVITGEKQIDPLTIFRLGDDSYFMGGLDLLVPALIKHKGNEDGA